MTVTCTLESRPGLSTRCTCPSGFGKCRSKDICLPMNLFCNGEDDCGDGSDEDADCGNCLGPIKFFTPQLLCDGKTDCSDGSDEASAECPDCKENHFRCDAHQLGPKPKCVPRSNTCDGTSDCNNGADEEGNTCMALAVEGLVGENELLMPENRTVGYLHVRLQGLWFPYCTSDWSVEHSRAICKELGFGLDASYFLRPRADAVNLLKSDSTAESSCNVVLLTCNSDQS